jgi:hypothetical protein
MRIVSNSGVRPALHISTEKYSAEMKRPAPYITQIIIW